MGEGEAIPLNLTFFIQAPYLSVCCFFLSKHLCVLTSRHCLVYIFVLIPSFSSFCFTLVVTMHYIYLWREKKNLSKSTEVLKTLGSPGCQRPSLLFPFDVFPRSHVAVAGCSLLFRTHSPSLCCCESQRDWPCLWRGLKSQQFPKMAVNLEKGRKS